MRPRPAPSGCPFHSETPRYAPVSSETPSLGRHWGRRTGQTRWKEGFHRALRPSCPKVAKEREEGPPAGLKVGMAPVKA